MDEWEKRNKLNRKKLSTGNFSREDLPPDVQEKVEDRATIYPLKLHKWVQVGGFEVLLDDETHHNDVPIAKLVLRYPPTVFLYWLRNLFTPLQKGVWVYDSCMVPFTGIIISKWWVGDGSDDGAFLVAFKKSKGPSVITG